MRKQNELAIEALRKQIQTIALDANLFDYGLADYPHAMECSQKRKLLNAEIVRLGGRVKLTPSRLSPNTKSVFGEGDEQLSFDLEV